MRTRWSLAVAAVVLIALGVGCFWLLSSASFSAVSEFDPVTGEPVQTSSAQWRSFVTSVAPVVGVASVALAVACGAGVVASLVVKDGIEHAAALRARPAPPQASPTSSTVHLSASEDLDG